MKKLLSIIAVCLLAAACNYSGTSEKKDSIITKPSGENLSMPYEAAYSTNFEIGNPKYAQIVLNIYKDYDNNAFNHSDAYADTVSMKGADGGTIRGKDVLINALKKYRNSIKSIRDTVDTYVVLKPKDKDETWVSVWSHETNTYKNGKIETIKFNENWEFNKAGKVAFISVYTAK